MNEVHSFIHSFILFMQEQMDVKFKKQFPTRKELEIVSSTRIWKREDKAARTLQNGWREYLRYLFRFIRINVFR